MALENNETTYFRKGLVLASIFLFLFFIPLLILGSRSFLTIDDDLDGFIPFIHIMSVNKQIYSFNLHEQIANMMNGVPRATVPTGFNISMLIFSLPNTLCAYIINYIIMHLIAFIGMLLLIRTHILTDKKSDYYSIFISLLFALVPFYTIYSGCVAAQPFLLYAFLNILKRKFSMKDFLIIFLFPFFSFNVVIGPFIVFALFIILCLNILTTKKINWYFFGGLAMLTILFVLTDTQLILYSFFVKGFISHRVEFDPSHAIEGNFNWWLIFHFIEMLTETQQHTGTFSTIPLILLTLIALSIWISVKRADRTALLLIISILLIAFFHVFYMVLMRAAGNRFPLFISLQWDRFYFLLPLIWFILSALCIKEISKYKVVNPFIYLMLTITLLDILYQNVEFRNNVKQVAHLKLHANEPNYRQFYAEKQFTAIKNFINLPQKDYRVGSIGLYPCVALYNGFYTVDGYNSSYDVNYKHRFRKVIAGELDKNKDLELYFDKWGSRCYLFTNELQRNYLSGKDSIREVNNLNLNWPALKSLNCRYIISSAKLNNLDGNAIRFEKEFEDPDSFWTIYLYKLI